MFLRSKLHLQEAALSHKCAPSASGKVAGEFGSHPARLLTKCSDHPFARDLGEPRLHYQQSNEAMVFGRERPVGAAVRIAGTRRVTTREGKPLRSKANWVINSHHTQL